MDIKQAIGKYEDTVEFADMNIDGKMLLLMTLVLSIVGFFLGSFIDIVLAILLALVVIDIGIGIPFFLANRKIDKLESDLPDVLHHMSTTLKTGGTVESAIKEASKMDYGPITDGLQRMLAEMREGSNFEKALRSFADRSRSELLQKVSMIIVAARKSGGGLVETLTAMSDNIRSIQRLKSERKTKTLLQFLFIIVAGCFVAPLVFGIVKSVLGILITIGAGGGSTELVGKFDLIFKAYLVMESALCTLGAVQVREGSYSKAVLYIPILVLITYVIYVLVASQFPALIGGTSGGMGASTMSMFLPMLT